MHVRSHCYRYDTLVLADIRVEISLHFVGVGYQLYIINVFLVLPKTIRILANVLSLPPVSKTLAKVKGIKFDLSRTILFAIESYDSNVRLSLLSSRLQKVLYKSVAITP